jgi:hypothetical protein
MTRIYCLVVLLVLASTCTPGWAQSDPMATATVLGPTHNSNYLVFGAPGTADVYPSSYHAMSFKGYPSTQYPTSIVAKNYVDSSVVNQAASPNGTATTDSNGDWATAFSIGGNFITFFTGLIR